MNLFATSTEKLILIFLAREQKKKKSANKSCRYVHREAQKIQMSLLQVLTQWIQMSLLQVLPQWIQMSLLQV